MFYYLYQITNKVNGKIYVGVHKTRNLNDGYMGSGKIIKTAIEKYGIDNFEKVIQEAFENAEAMYAREKEIVTEEFLSRDHVYNLRRGGDGGFDFINKNLTEKDRSILGKKGGFANKHKWSDEILQRAREGWSKGGKKTVEQIRTGKRKMHKSFLGKHHSDETKQKMSNTIRERKLGIGEKNSQYGTRWAWVHNDEKVIKIKLEELDTYISLGYVRGIKIKG
jgi:hypothetical protein